RLTPPCNQAPLATSLRSFGRYQREAAWTSEHMALCRARPVFGSDTTRQPPAGVVRVALVKPRHARPLRAAIVATPTNIDPPHPARRSARRQAAARRTGRL